MTLSDEATKRFVEVASLAVLALCCAVQARSGGLRRFLREAAAIACAGWLSEDLCIRAFAFYGYAPGWTVQLDQVPLLVAVIWPFVILSGRELARATLPSSPHLALRVGLAVTFDACLMEPVAVKAGLWSWSEPGLFGVPLLGVVGWGVLAGLVTAWLERGLPLLLLPLVAALGSNTLLCAMWWGLFRWGPRSDLPAVAAFALIGTAALAWLIAFRRRRAAVGLLVMGPRVAAAWLFFALVALRGDALLAAWMLPFALPYLWVSGLRADVAPEHSA